MNEFTKLFIVSTLAGALSITGCSSESAPQDSAAHSDHDHEKDHGETDHDAHDHAGGDDDDHAPTRPLGTVVIAGTTLEISAGGELDPGAMLNVNIEHSDGPIPAVIRFWIGNEAGDGALRSKADGSSGGYHGHGEVPAEIDADTALWIEIETSNGERVRGSVPLS